MEAGTTISSTASRSRPWRGFCGRRPEGGFTLVEIILAVAIFTVMVGGAAVFLGSNSAEDEFSRARRSLEEAAQQARAQALQSGRDQWVSLYTNGVAESPFAPGIELDLLTPQEMSAGIYTWGRPASRGYDWYFSRYGWLEPLRVRLRARGGQEQTFFFAALTAELIAEPAGR